MHGVGRQSTIYSSTVVRSSQLDEAGELGAARPTTVQ
jgi:hypothetical protein